MQLTNGAGVEFGNFHEGTFREDQVGYLGATGDTRREPLAGDLIGQGLDRVTSRFGRCVLPTDRPPYLVRTTPTGDDLEEHPRKLLVWTIVGPPSMGIGRKRVEAAGPTGADRRGLRLDKETRITQLGKMLADGRVVQHEVRFELRYRDRTTMLVDVFEDRVPRRVAQCPSLTLQRVCSHGTSIAAHVPVSYSLGNYQT